MDACHLSNITKLKKKKKNTGLTSLFGYCSQPKKKAAAYLLLIGSSRKGMSCKGGRGRRGAIVRTTLKHCYKRGSGQRDLIVISTTQHLSGDG
jgi:hypothetical protein